VRLVLAGRVAEHVQETEGVHRLGHISKITEAYALGDAVINPVQYGTGLNIKSIEALGHGMPLVSTPAGARGLEHGAGEAYLLAESDIEFVDAVIGLLSDMDLAVRLSREACSFARKWNALQLKGLFTALDHEQQSHSETAKDDA
jgi:glycosyltransferase involved in cell wall biosynthesis